VGTTEQNTRGKWIRLFGLAALGVIFIIGALSSFPVIQYRGNRIRMFAPERLLGRMPRIQEIIRPEDLIVGWVLGEHVLRTEHGEITLRNRTHIEAASNTVAGISVENFRQGRASHNLVVVGIELPQNISIGFDTRRRNLAVSLILLHDQEISVSNVPLTVRNFDLDPPRSTADIQMGFMSPEYITLVDTTQLRTRRIFRSLHIFKDEERWMITGQTFVRRPGETVFTEYRSVTFEPNWGAFIEGEPR